MSWQISFNLGIYIEQDWTETLRLLYIKGIKRCGYLKQCETLIG